VHWFRYQLRAGCRIGFTTSSRRNAVIPSNAGAMRLLIMFLLLVAAGGSPAVAGDVPLPKPRPAVWIEPRSFREAAGPDFSSADITNAPSDCDQRLAAIAAIEPMPRLIGPDACGGGDMVRLDAVMLANGRRIELKP